MSRTCVFLAVLVMGCAFASGFFLGPDYEDVQAYMQTSEYQQAKAAHEASLRAMEAGLR